jgi:hypothetical protein
MFEERIGCFPPLLLHIEADSDFSRRIVEIFSGAMSWWQMLVVGNFRAKKTSRAMLRLPRMPLITTGDTPVMKTRSNMAEPVDDFTALNTVRSTPTSCTSALQWSQESDTGSIITVLAE